MKDFKNTFYYRNWRKVVDRNSKYRLWITASIVAAGITAMNNFVLEIIFLILLSAYLIYTIKDALIIIERRIVKKKYNENKFFVACNGFFRIQDDAGAIAIYIDTEYGTKHIHSELIDPCYDYKEVSYYATKHHLVIIDIN